VIVLFANTDWYLYNFRRSLALALCTAGYEVLLLSPPGPYGEKLLSLGLRWEPVPMSRRSLDPIREIRVLAHLRRLFMHERPSLVHGFTIKCAIYGSIAARLAGVPKRVNAVAGMGYVFTSRDLKARLLRPLVRGLMRLSLGGPGSRLVLQNPDDRDLFIRAGLVEPSRVRLIMGSGVDCNRFVPSARERRDKPLQVLLPARLLWDKGIAEFVEAARQLHREGRAVECLLAGAADAGNPASVPDATVQGWMAEGLVHWLGHVDDMPALLEKVDVVVLPSYREGLPKGLIEAAASGLPLVTTDVPGCREVVTHGLNGLLVPARNAQALARAIAVLQDDPCLASRLGRRARHDALARFDERIVIERTMAVYSELLGVRHRNGRFTPPDA
jgi:glycosyltransferase involved in cell wall biosynthesis